MRRRDMMIDLSVSCTIDRPVAGVVSIVKAVCATPQRLYAFPYDMAVEEPSEGYGLMHRKTTDARAGSTPRVTPSGMTRFVMLVVEHVAMRFDERGEIEGMAADDSLRQIGVAALERVDDVLVIGDRTRRAVALRNREPADRAHVRKTLESVCEIIADFDSFTTAW